MTVLEGTLILGGIALFAFFTRGVVGGGSGITFNATWVTLYMLGLTGALTMHDGLYWFALANGISAIPMLAKVWRQLHIDRMTVLFLAGTLPVNITFSLLLARFDSTLLAILLSIVVIGAGLHLVTRPTRPPLEQKTLERLALPVGVAAGTIGGLFGMGGPITFLLLSRTTDDPTRFRSYMTVFTTVASTVRLITLSLQGVYTADRLLLAAGTVPPIFIGILLGVWAHRFFSPRSFRLGLGGLVCLGGALALIQALR